MIENIMNYIIKSPWWKIFLTIWLVHLINLFIYNQFVWSEDIYFSGSGMDTKYGTFESVMRRNRNFDLFFYFLSPFWLFIKVILVSFFVFMGSQLADLKTTFIYILKLATLSYVVILIGDISNTIHFLVISPPIHRDEIDFFYPWSLMNVTSDYFLQKNQMFVLRRLHLFQLFFVFAISILFSIVNKEKIGKSVFLVFSSYGLAYLAFLGIVYLINM